MAAPVSDELIAGLLNRNLNSVDKNNLTDVIVDYFTESLPSGTYSDTSDSDTEDRHGMEEDADDDCHFTPIRNMADAILPPPKRTPAAATDICQLPTSTDDKLLCSCTLNDGLPCHSIFSPELLADICMQYEALSKNKRDVAILAKIESGIHLGEQTERSKKAQTARKRTRNDYFLHGRRICRDLFQHLHCIGETQLEKLIKHYKNVGVEPRVHGSKKKLPSNALSYEDNKRVVDFIVHYADIHAITLPGRTPHHWRSDLQLLPTNCMKQSVYNSYKEASILAAQRIAAERTFRRIWQHLVPFITPMKPASDLCFKCQQGAAKVARCANLPEEAKSLAIAEMEEHLLRVTQERSYLRSVLEETKRNLPSHLQLEPHPSCSFDGTVHYSFDFAQQLQFPSNPLQPGPIYFKVPRKCGLFGIHCEALLKQVNLLIDEGVSVGKGADCVISLLHYFFENFGLGETSVHLHADNCSGQNKNSAVLQYLLWRVLTGRHESVILSFLITGHTIFAPDGAFGLIKRKYRKTEVNSLSQLADVVTSSSTMNMVQLCGNEGGEIIVPSFHWTAFLGSHFKKLEGIKQFQHFRFRQDGTVAARRFAESTEEPQKLLRASTKLSLPDEFPEPKGPSGLDLQRRHYLYKEIRPFVADDFKGVVAPEPEQELVTVRAAEPAQSESAMDETGDSKEPPPKKSKGKGRGKKRNSA